MKLVVQIRQLDADLPVPSYAHDGDAGADLVSSEDVELAPGERRLVGTGMALAIPEGYAGFVHPRSGLAARHGLTIVNTPGTIDAGYRGEIRVCLLNTDRETPIVVHRGDRIAQIVIQAIVQAEFAVVDELPDSERGAGGYGSSGGVAAWASEVE